MGLNEPEWGLGRLSGLPRQWVRDVSRVPREGMVLGARVTYSPSLIRAHFSLWIQRLPRVGLDHSTATFLRLAPVLTDP